MIKEWRGPFKNGHELKDCEGPADLQVLDMRSSRLRTEE